MHPNRPLSHQSNQTKEKVGTLPDQSNKTPLGQASGPPAENTRDAFIAAVHRFGAWLTDNPGVPVPTPGQKLYLALHTNPAVEAFAEEHGIEVVYDDEGNASADVTFGAGGLFGYHVYGYVDFADHCDRNAFRVARQYAEKHGLTITPADTPGGAS